MPSADSGKPGGFPGEGGKGCKTARKSGKDEQSSFAAQAQEHVQGVTTCRRPWRAGSHRGWKFWHFTSGSDK
jgi:hypothetical protein